MHWSLAAAKRQYKQLIEEAGGYPRTSTASLTSEERRKRLIAEDIHLDLNRTESYWGSSRSHSKGGKLRNVR
jgi:hypothetical protein